MRISDSALLNQLDGQKCPSAEEGTVFSRQDEVRFCLEGEVFCARITRTRGREAETWGNPRAPVLLAGNDEPGFHANLARFLSVRPKHARSPAEPNSSAFGSISGAHDTGRAGAVENRFLILTRMFGFRPARSTDHAAENRSVRTWSSVRKPLFHVKHSAESYAQPLMNARSDLCRRPRSLLRAGLGCTNAVRARLSPLLGPSFSAKEAAREDRSPFRLQARASVYSARK